VPKVERRYVPSPVYLIQRFDRMLDSHAWLRTHCIDACQLLNLDKTYKYQQGSIARLADLANLCRNKPMTRVRLYEWLVYIVLTGNGDAHLKNLSFTVGHEGIAIAPHYDLLSTAVFDTRAFSQDAWPQRSELAWPILGIRRFCQIDRALMLEVGRSLNLARHTCERILDKLAGRIVEQSQTLLQEIEQENASLHATHGPALAATLAGETRGLRAIIEIVVKAMAVQLSRVEP